MNLFNFLGTTPKKTAKTTPQKATKTTPQKATKTTPQKATKAAVQKPTAGRATKKASEKTKGGKKPAVPELPKKRMDYTLQQMANAVVAARSKQMSISEASRVYSVPKTTLNQKVH